ncbi:MAG: right-handed parallel beta-helix repeat-containing protein [Kiritimatiellae bacterium]|nr:right-handed parallel beta-helix repeat-containing protein [Kiritimatiellia bacterium]
MKKSIVSLVVILVAGIVFGQGSLTPSNAPSATMKTLQQVEPRIDLAMVEPLFGYDHYIGTSGSYYLSSNVSVTNTSGILVNAKNITLDLNGFTVSRASGSGGNGIEISSLATGCTVRNGSIKGFASGIYGQAENSLFKDLSISECLTYGVNGFSYAQVIDCVVFDNSGSGISMREGSVISGCDVNNHQGTYAIFANSRSVITKCIVSDNICSYGVYVSLHSKITDCNIFRNTGQGIYAKSGSYISDCVVSTNGNIGIYGGDNVTVLDCTSINNQGTGISLSSGGVISGCTSSDNQDDGIRTLDGARVSGCIFSGNRGHGMIAGDGANISSCASIDNQGYGILGSAGSVISKCNAYTNNGTYGIYGAKGSLISACSANYNNSKRGIYGSYNSQIISCTASYNAGADSESYGIHADAGSSVINCTANGNTNTNFPSSNFQGCGIYASASSIKNCSVMYNQGDGIRATSGSYIEGNQCRANGSGDGIGAGIHITSSDNRIEGNNLIANDNGLEVDITGNFIVKNTASGNTTNYVVAAGNDLGTIQTSPVAAGAWDNFEF